MVATRESLGPVFVISERLADVAAFYEDIVGLPVANREEQHHVWFRVGSIDFAIHAPEPEVGPDYTPKDRGVLIWFRSERPLDEVIPRLEARKLPYWGPYDGGLRELLIHAGPGRQHGRPVRPEVAH